MDILSAFQLILQLLHLLLEPAYIRGELRFGFSGSYPRLHPYLLQLGQLDGQFQFELLPGSCLCFHYFLHP